MLFLVIFVGVKLIFFRIFCCEGVDCIHLTEYRENICEHNNVIKNGFLYATRFVRTWYDETGKI